MFFTTLTSHKHLKYIYSYMNSSTLPALHWTVRCSLEPCENWVWSTPYNSWWKKKKITVVSMCQYNVSVQCSVHRNTARDVKCCNVKNKKLIIIWFLYFLHHLAFQTEHSTACFCTLSIFLRSTHSMTLAVYVLVQHLVFQKERSVVFQNTVQCPPNITQC